VWPSQGMPTRSPIAKPVTPAPAIYTADDLAPGNDRDSWTGQIATPVVESGVALSKPRPLTRKTHVPSIECRRDALMSVRSRTKGQLDSAA
jgi:hypothetical protein